MASDYVSIQGQSTTQNTGATSGSKPQAEPIKSTSNTLHVASLTEVPAVGSGTFIADLTTTRQRLSFAGGALWVHIVFADVGTTAVNAQYAKIVIGTEDNAVSEAQADGLLATTGCYAVGLGDSISFAGVSDNKIETLDVIAAAAVGAGKTILSVMWGT